MIVLFSAENKLVRLVFNSFPPPEQHFAHFLFSTVIQPCMKPLTESEKSSLQPEPPTVTTILSLIAVGYEMYHVAVSDCRALTNGVPPK